jgi:hypothetical protein
VANKKNLRPQAHKLTVEEQSNGGKKSAEVRREKKLLKDCMLDLLSLPVADARNYNKLVRLGLNLEDIDNRSLLTVALFKKAVETGDVSAFREIRNLIGEDKTDNEDVMNKLDDVLKMIKEND